MTTFTGVGKTGLFHKNKDPSFVATSPASDCGFRDGFHGDEVFSWRWIEREKPGLFLIYIVSKHKGNPGSVVMSFADLSDAWIVLPHIVFVEK